MKSKIWSATLLIAIVAVTAAIINTSRNSQSAAEDSAAAERPDVSEVTVAGEQSRDTSGQILEGIKPSKAAEFFDSESALSAHALIEEAERDGDLRFVAWAESRLNTYCAPRDQLSVHPYPDTAWARDNLQVYCDGFDTSASERHLARMKAGRRTAFDQEATALRSALKDLEDGEKIQLLSSYVGAAESPFEIDGAVKVMNEISSNQPEWESIFDLGSNNSYSDVQNAQLAAGEILKCQSFGGCSAGDVQMIHLCSESPACDPTWGITDLLQHTMSPGELRLAIHLVNQLKEAEDP